MQNSYTNRLLSFKKSLENLKSAKTADKDNRLKKLRFYRSFLISGE